MDSGKYYKMLIKLTWFSLCIDVCRFINNRLITDRPKADTLTVFVWLVSGNSFKESF